MSGNDKQELLKIPEWLKFTDKKNDTFPIYFIDIRGKGLELNNPQVRDRLNRKLMDVFQRLELDSLDGPGVIKVATGEPRSVTAMLPELVKAEISFLKEKGINCIIGDTTVIYSGPRGKESNPMHDVSSYMENVVKPRRWSMDNTGVPFVILDRPITSVPGIFEFSEDETIRSVKSPGYYSHVYIAGGIEKAGMIFNNAHLTMHGLSPLALCVKGLAMGGSGNKGKLQMHSSLIMRIDSGLCTMCGTCARDCPVRALRYQDGEVPVLNREKCVGCGECLAHCPANAIDMIPRETVRWDKERDTFPRRLADYLIGMMNGKWGKLINVGHLYRVTSECDCHNIEQKSIFSDIGLAVSRNPFALDLFAARVFDSQIKDEGAHYNLGNYNRVFEYVRDTYGIIVEPDVIAV